MGKERDSALTFGLAAERLGKRCGGAEIEPVHYPR